MYIIPPIVNNEQVQELPKELLNLTTDWIQEHKPSCTIYVKDNEWMEVGAWVIKNWKWVSGISFLPHTNNVYQLAPYETIDEDTYNKLLKELPKIDFSELPKWEIVDSTNGSREFACAGGKCEL